MNDPFKVVMIIWAIVIPLAIAIVSIALLRLPEENPPVKKCSCCEHHK